MHQTFQGLLLLHAFLVIINVILLLCDEFPQQVRDDASRIKHSCRESLRACHFLKDDDYIRAFQPLREWIDQVRE
jgi:hypothetical protein